MDPMMAKKMLYLSLAKKMHGGHLDDLRQKYGKSKSEPIPGVEDDVPGTDADEAANALAVAAQETDALAEHQEGGKIPDVALEEVGDVSEGLDPLAASPIDDSELQAMLQQLLPKTE